jgi:4-amino-4-deoxy-L-arabinose transferase-like glycosyltransferase
VSTTGQDSQAPLVSPATVAEWRRRQEASSQVLPSSEDGEHHVDGFQFPGDADAISSDDEGKRANGFQANGHAAVNGSKKHAATNGSTGTTDRSFAQSQQAGIRAMVSFATLESGAITEPLPVVTEPLASPRTQVSTAEPALPVPVIVEPQVIDQPELPVRPATVGPDRAPATRSRDSWTQRAYRYIYVPRLSIFIIVTVQAVLSLRLVWSNTAFTDEALYLWAGHLEWSHWLHGTPIPPFSAYFSGAPIVYPPIAALADSVGGLAGARILSLCFMLGATSLLWATATRLYGKRAGLFAAGLWAFLGPTLKLGAFATFDPMSLFLLALSAWCAVRAAERRNFTRWIVASAAALILANAAAYSYAIFDPVVLAMALLAGWHEQSAKLSKMRGAALAAYVTSVLILLIDAGGGSYLAGISATVLSRTPGTDPATLVLKEAWGWVAPVAVVAAAGLLICIVAERSRQQRALITVLVGAIVLVPVEQARIHTTTSLDKHTDVGAWFAAIAAGYAANKISQLRIPGVATAIVTAASVAALAIPVGSGFFQARELYGWANSRAFVAAFRPLAEHSTGPLLVENPSPVRYYLGSAVRWERWSSTWAITLPNGTSIGSSGVTISGIPGIYLRRVQSGFFTLIALNSTTTPTLDDEIIQAIATSHRYRLIDAVPYDGVDYAGYYAIWERTAARSAR